MRKTDRFFALFLITAMIVISCSACHGDDGSKTGKDQETSWYIDSKNRENEAAAQNSASDSTGNRTADSSSADKENASKSDASGSSQSSSSASEDSQDKSSDSAGSSSDASSAGSSSADNTQSSTDKQDTASGDAAGSQTGTSKDSGDKKTEDTGSSQSGSADGDNRQDSDAEASDNTDAGGTETEDSSQPVHDSDPADTSAGGHASGEDSTDSDSEQTSDSDTMSSSGDSEQTDPDNAELRHKAWASTFLVWIPEFTEGVYVGLNSEDTFDFALFEKVTDRKQFDEYIAALIEAGFDDDPDTGLESQNAWFYAGNDQGWRVSVDYNLNTGIMKIGSGYDDGFGSDNSDQVNKVWSTTALSMLPVPEEGLLETYQGGSDSYAVLSGFPKLYADSYVEGLKELGFIYDVDEGEGDGVTWFIAEDIDGNCAAFVFSDGVAKIMCSKAEY